MPHTFGFDSVSGGGGGGGGITDLNGLVVATQSFAVGSAGVDFNIISASPTHTFNLPDASAITRGALTSADWSTFNGKLSTAILSINGMTGTAQTINSGTAGVDFNISSVGDITTLNLPTASAVNRGALSSADWSTFNGKLSTAILSINGMTGTAQTINSGSTGTDLNIASVGNTTTINLPTASAVNRGALSSADWSTFNGKLSTAILSINGMTGTAQTINSGTTGTDLNIASAGNVTTINIPDASTTARGLVTTGTQTFGGAKTFTNNAESSLLVNGTYTTTASATSHLAFSGTITARNTAGDLYYFLNITPSLIATANQQTLSAVRITPTYTNFGTGTNVTRRYSLIVDDLGISGFSTSVIIGQSAGRNIFGGGFENVIIGADALLNNATGYYNVAVGRSALSGSGTNQASNVGVGYRSGFQLTSGQFNVIVGSEALRDCTNGGSNVIIGRFTANTIASTGASNTNLQNSVIIGSASVTLANSDTNAIVLGYNTQGQGSNTAVIGNNSITKTFIKGDTAIGYSPTTATITPNGKVDILGSSAISGNALIVSNSTPTEIFKITNTGSVIINESGSIFGGGQGFRVETDLNTHALYVDYSSNSVGINNASPSFTLDIGGTCASALFSTYGQMELQDGTGAFLSVGSTESIAFADGGFIRFGSFGGNQIGTASSQQFAFWGGTPVAQPNTGVASATRVGVASTNIQTNDTFDGYTLAQVVGALRRIGLLA